MHEIGFIQYSRQMLPDYNQKDVKVLDSFLQHAVNKFKLALKHNVSGCLFFKFTCCLLGNKNVLAYWSCFCNYLPLLPLMQIIFAVVICICSDCFVLIAGCIRFIGQPVSGIRNKCMDRYGPHVLHNHDSRLRWLPQLNASLCGSYIVPNAYGKFKPPIY